MYLRKDIVESCPLLIYLFMSSYAEPLKDCQRNNFTQKTTTATP